MPDTIGGEGNPPLKRHYALFPEDTHRCYAAGYDVILFMRVSLSLQKLYSKSYFEAGRSGAKRSILDVCEHLRRKPDAKRALLGNFFLSLLKELYQLHHIVALGRNHRRVDAVAAQQLLDGLATLRPALRIVLPDAA